MKDNITPEEYVKRIVNPIFDKVLKETSKNPLSVGLVGFKEKEEPKTCFYNPHNYRLYFRFFKDNFNPNQFIKTEQKRSVVTPYKIKNSTELEFKTIESFTITVKKNLIEIRNLITPKRRYPIEMNEQVIEQFVKIIRTKDLECLNTLKTFIKIYGGTSDFIIVNRYCHNKLEHEDFIDLLPIKMQFHTKVVDKLYMEKNIEMPEPAFAANYIQTRALENKVPEIKDRLDKLIKVSENLVKQGKVRAEQDRLLTENLKSHLELINKFKEESDLNRKSLNKLINVVTRQTKPSKIRKKDISILLPKINNPSDCLKFKRQIKGLNKKDKKRLERHLYRLK